ncbi:hypothetical protein COLO4_06028 [Corchorus olitorius]|uniref:Uncharacterized protein n=1 Tax=Corchorus olitorius TaxID=93759 RepID=A0A1R3KP53_9ROSI|nr:hypothetical protein COLO4_06028 [Corchorus olitorius]
MILEIIVGSSCNAFKFVLKARFDANSELVGELVTANGFKAAYAIKDGAEGPRGWLVFVIVLKVSKVEKLGISDVFNFRERRKKEIRSSSGKEEKKSLPMELVGCCVEPLPTASLKS